MPMRSAKSSKRSPPACGRKLGGASNVIGVVAMVWWQTRGFAYGFALFLGGAASWRLLGYSQATTMPRAGIHALYRTHRLTTRGVPCQRVEVCGNARQHTEHLRLVKRDKLMGILGIGTQIDHHHLTTIEPCEPVDTPPQHFDLVGNVRFHHGIG